VALVEHLEGQNPPKWPVCFRQSTSRICDLDVKPVNIPNEHQTHSESYVELDFSMGPAGADWGISRFVAWEEKEGGN
jgi:hypothetical protein